MRKVMAEIKKVAKEKTLPLLISPDDTTQGVQYQTKADIRNDPLIVGLRQSEITVEYKVEIKNSPISLPTTTSSEKKETSTAPTPSSRAPDPASKPSPNTSAKS
jgi:hypothetical protein